MKQKKNVVADQVLYLGRWVDKKTFRAFVYNESDQKLAKNYDEYSDLIQSGLWFSTKDAVISDNGAIPLKRVRKAKDGAVG